MPLRNYTLIHSVRWTGSCMPTAHVVGALSDNARLTSVWRMSVWRLSVCRVHRPNSRTQRPKKTKIGTEVGSPRHTWLGRHFHSQRVKGQLAGGGGILWRPLAQVVYHRRNIISCNLSAHLIILANTRAALGWAHCWLAFDMTLSNKYYLLTYLLTYSAEHAPPQSPDVDLGFSQTL